MTIEPAPRASMWGKAARAETMYARRFAAIVLTQMATSIDRMSVSSEVNDEAADPMSRAAHP